MKGDKITVIKVVRNAFIIVEEKSRIRETKNLSTDADSSTDTTVGWGGPRIPKNPIFLKNGKIIQNAKNQKILEICQN